MSQRIPSTATTITTSTTTAAASATEVAAESSPWWVRHAVQVPPLDRQVTTRVMQQCHAEVGELQLVTQISADEAAQLKVSGAQYSVPRAVACARATEMLGTEADKGLAVQIDQQVSDINELGLVAQAHLDAQDSYSHTLGKRRVLVMGTVRDQEERILLLGAQERTKASPDARILTAVSLVEAARQNEAEGRKSTQQENAARQKDSNAEIDRLSKENAQLRKMNEELLQGISQTKAQLFNRDASSALGGSAAGGTAAGGTAASSTDRRQGGR